jgi:hypothetical protein
MGFGGRRQSSVSGTSRMMREYQVRFCERLGVKFPGPTRRSISWLLPLQLRPWRQQWRKPPGAVVLGQAAEAPLVPGHQRPRIVKWVLLVPTRPQTRRPPHWARRTHLQARQQIPIRRPWAVAGRECRPGPRAQPQALVANPIDVATASRLGEAEGAAVTA